MARQAVVTGGARGIGAAIGKRLRAGADDALSKTLMTFPPQPPAMPQ